MMGFGLCKYFALIFPELGVNRMETGKSIRQTLKEKARNISERAMANM